MTRVDGTRAEWEQGYRRFLEEARKPRRTDTLHVQLELVSGALRKRVGGQFTLQELADAYTDSERWARAALEDRIPSRDWAPTLTLVGDAAFHLYSRGAVDYVP